ASESHSMRNLRRSRDEQWANVGEMAGVARGEFRVIGTISVAFGCPFEGAVDPERVLGDIAMFANHGVRDVALGDTVGRATPPAVRSLFTRAAVEFPETNFIAHFHDTR